jgi:hypothetical protein
MHVHTETALSPDEVKARFQARTEAGYKTARRTLLYARDHTPPKFFLPGALVTLPAAAEVSLGRLAKGTDVVLRLMWGPLPAPFPRAVAAASVLIGLLIAIFSDRTIGNWLLAALVVFLPAAALLYQHVGERELQSQLSDMLDGAKFLPKPH